MSNTQIECIWNECMTGKQKDDWKSQQKIRIEKYGGCLEKVSNLLKESLHAEEFEYVGDCYFPNDKFPKFKHLKKLILNGCHGRLAFLDRRINPHDHPEGLSCICGLEELEMYDYATEYIFPPERESKIGELSKLKKLTIATYNFPKFPIEICSLMNLEKIYISSIMCGIIPKEITNLRMLKEFCIRVQNDYIRLPTNMSSLSLEILEIREETRSRVRTDAEERKFHRVISSMVTLKCMTYDSEFSFKQGYLNTLRKLTNLESLNIKGYPDFDDALCNNLYISSKSLKKLRLEKGDAKVLPFTIENVPNLSALLIHGKFFINFQKSTQFISELDVYSPGYGRILSSARFPNLKHLKLLYGTEPFPMAIFQLTTLESLDIHGGLDQEHSSTFPVEISRLFNLKKITLELADLENIPAELCEINSLEELVIQSQRSLKLPENMRNLTNLKKLVLLCPHMKTLPDVIRDLKMLEYLHFEMWYEKGIPKLISDLVNLRYLFMELSQPAFDVESEVDYPMFLKELSLRAVGWCNIYYHKPIVNLTNIAKLIYLEKLTLPCGSTHHCEFPPEFSNLKMLKEIKTCSDCHRDTTFMGEPCPKITSENSAIVLGSLPKLEYITCMGQTRSIHKIFKNYYKTNFKYHIFQHYPHYFKKSIEILALIVNLGREENDQNNLLNLMANEMLNLLFDALLVVVGY